MFEEPARLIKAIAKVLCVFNVIGAFVLAFVFGRDPDWSDWHFHFGFFLLILIPCLFIGYVIPLLIYGFGQLIENTDTINNSTYKAEKNSKVFNNIMSSTPKDEEKQTQTAKSLLQTINAFDAE